MHAIPKNETRVAARFLEEILLLSLVVHFAALVCSPLLLRGLPGGSFPGTAQRAAYLTVHPWLWRLGWLPWQAAALVNVLMALALWRTSWIPRLPAAAVMLFTLLAVTADQAGETLLVTRGLDIASTAHRSGDLLPFLVFENKAYTAVFVLGGMLYLCMAVCWSWCFAVAGTWDRTLSALSLLTWGILAAGSGFPLLPEMLRPGRGFVGAINAAGLTLLLFWLACCGESIAPSGRTRSMAAWRRGHPWSGLIGRALEVAGNSRLLRAYCEWLPPLAFLSDITDVIYVNYLVEAERLEPFVPAGLDLQHIGRAGRYALFTHLTYRHGHFGPRLARPVEAVAAIAGT